MTADDWWKEIEDMILGLDYWERLENQRKGGDRCRH